MKLYIPGITDREYEEDSDRDLLITPGGDIIKEIDHTNKMAKRKKSVAKNSNGKKKLSGSC